MSLKQKDPTLFNLFLKDSNLTGYLVGLIAGAYKANPALIVSTVKEAVAASPELSTTEAVAYSMRDSLIAYHEHNYQEGTSPSGFGFNIATVDDIVKNMSTNTGVGETGRLDASNLLNGTYLKVN